jgi:hypothetical protein
MRARQLWRGVGIGVLLLVAFGFASSIFGLAGKAHIAVSQAREAEWQYRELKARRAALEADIAALATPRGRDAAIRTSFGVARPGEEVIVVVPPVAATSTPVPPWWQKIFEWF